MNCSIDFPRSSELIGAPLKEECKDTLASYVTGFQKIAIGSMHRWLDAAAVPPPTDVRFMHVGSRHTGARALSHCTAVDCNTLIETHCTLARA